MTEQHECEWELKSYLYVGVPIFGCKILGCNKKLAVGQAEARLNEYETLKKATEVLREFIAIVLCWKPEWAQTTYFKKLSEGLKNELIELAKSTKYEGSGGIDNEWLNILEGNNENERR